MNRWLRILLSIVGGAIVGYCLFLLAAGAILGILWLYVFGDDPWPAWSDYVVGSILLIGGAAAWYFSARTIWTHLKREAGQ